MDYLRPDLDCEVMYLIDILSATGTKAKVMESRLSLIESFVPRLIVGARYIDAGSSANAV
jgi:hypothetical protein